MAFFLRLTGSPAHRLAFSKARRVLWAAALLISAISVQTGAYGPATVRRMTDVTLRLAPPSLRAVLLANRGSLDRGVTEALVSFGHSPEKVVLAEAQREFEVIRILPSSQTPLAEIAYHFGKLAGLIYAANDPLARGEDGRARQVREDYSGYIERKLPLMVFAFDGYGSPPLETDLRAYLAARATGEGRYREAVLFCYFPQGRQVSSETFDDRSNAFGTAQVVLSHAVSDAAKAWLQIWRGMDGDLSATPYYRPAELRTGSGASKLD
jgi:hypothetical protein